MDFLVSHPDEHEARISLLETYTEAERSHRQEQLESHHAELIAQKAAIRSLQEKVASLADDMDSLKLHDALQEVPQQSRSEVYHDFSIVLFRNQLSSSFLWSLHLCDSS